ncbi:MAG: hypothetical protein KDB14_30380, partial [Planctomycetales bacterium]|nr:hypothetical protein [Planctomycetales bacterium]
SRLSYAERAVFYPLCVPALPIIVVAAVLLPSMIFVAMIFESRILNSFGLPRHSPQTFQIMGYGGMLVGCLWWSGLCAGLARVPWLLDWVMRPFSTGWMRRLGYPLGLLLLAVVMGVIALSR